MSETDEVTAAWEDAYESFETPEQEQAKFSRRLHQLGIDRLDEKMRVIEIFCGRGNGMVALRALGFDRVHGTDLSLSLLALSRQPNAVNGDCRALPYRPESFDVVIVQGGLHHLQDVDRELELVLSEVVRVLRHGGLFVAVEPWMTPFLKFVHEVTEWRLARAISKKVNALATMIELEGGVYRNWLSHAGLITEKLQRHFEARHQRSRLGKLYYVGVRK